MNRRIPLIVAAAVVLAGGAVAYVVTSHARPTSVLRVGAVVVDPPATGHDLGRAVRDGLTLAQEDLNAEWRDNPRVEVVIADSGASISAASDRLVELKKQGISLFAEVVGSDTLAGCAGTVRKENLLVLTAVDSDPKLTNAFGPNFFRATPNDAYLAIELVRWTREFGCQRPALVVNEGERGALLRGAFLQACCGLGLDRVFTIVPGQVKAQKIVEQLAKATPDAALILTGPDDAAELIAEARARGLTLRFLGTSASLDPERLKKLGGPELLTSLVFFAPEVVSGASRRGAVEASWRRTFGSRPGAPTEPPAAVYAAYDALQVLARAAKDSSSDVKRVSARLRTIDYDGATGRLAFDENGERRAPPLGRRTFTDQGVSIPFAAEAPAGPVGPASK